MFISKSTTFLHDEMCLEGGTIWRMAFFMNLVKQEKGGSCIRIRSE